MNGKWQIADLLMLCALTLHAAWRPPSLPDSLIGTVQVCSHCCAFVDVGELDWQEDDFGEPDEE